MPWPFRVRIVFVVSLAATLTASSLVEGAKFNRKVDLEKEAPAFGPLEGTDGKSHSLSDYAKSKAVVLVFTCNHCPVAQAYEERLIAFTKEYAEKGVAVVAIGCSRLELDDLAHMQERAKERKFPYDYLADPSQKSGLDYGATVTPHLFLLDKDRKIAYMGAFDDSMNPSKVKKTYLKDAVDAVLAGQKPEIGETLQIGCRIEYESE